MYNRPWWTWSKGNMCTSLAVWNDVPIYNCGMLWRVPWRFVHSWGGNGHFPSRVYKTHGPQSQRATIVLLYLCIIVIPLLEVLLSSSIIITTIHYLISRWTRNNSLEPTVVSYTALEIDQRRERSRWCTPMYITFHVTRPVVPCNMRFCCASHDWFSTNQTSQFVTEV